MITSDKIIATKKLSEIKFPLFIIDQFFIIVYKIFII